MKLKRGVVPWLGSTLAFGALIALLAANPGDDPISGGLIYMAMCALAIGAAISLLGLAVAALR